MKKKILIAGFACLSLMAVAQSSGSKDQAASAAQTKDAHPKDVATGQASGKTVAPRDIATGQSSGKVVSKPAGSQAVLNSSDSASSEQVTAPRDLATGQASGKRQYQPVIIRKVSDDDAMAAREQQSPKATGKVMASDDWHATTAKSSGSSSVSPAVVNQDGAANRESPALPSKGQTRVATGDVNGDGKADVARVAKGDVTGDGKADAAINNSHSNIKNSKDAASGQASGKRVHGDITITKEAGAAPKQ